MDPNISEILLRNILLGITLAVPVGPAGVAVIQTGLRHGFRRAFLTGLGITLADTTYLLLVFFGLAAALDNLWIKVAIWLFGAAVLINFGIRSLRESGSNAGQVSGAAVTARHPLVSGYLVNISNPIAIVWWIGVFGSLLSESAGTLSRLQALGLSASILIGIMSWHTTTSLLTHWGSRYLNAGVMKWVTRAAGLALTLFGLRFAFFALEAVVNYFGMRLP